MTWISDLPREDLPPLDRNPHFDTDKIVSVDGVDSFLYDPVYGSIFFSFTGLSILDIIPVRGVVHSIEVVSNLRKQPGVLLIIIQQRRGLAATQIMLPLVHGKVLYLTLEFTKRHYNK